MGASILFFYRSVFRLTRVILIRQVALQWKPTFLPRDAMHKHGICCHAVSVCVMWRHITHTCVTTWHTAMCQVVTHRCVSVTFVICVKTNKHVFKFFSPPGSQAIVFQLQTAWRYSDGNPPNGGVECRWGKQKSRFLAYIWLSCLLLTLQQARCCQHSRRWTIVAQVVTHRW